MWGSNGQAANQMDWDKRLVEIFDKFRFEDEAFKDQGCDCKCETDTPILTIGSPRRTKAVVVDPEYLQRQGNGVSMVPLHAMKAAQTLVPAQKDAWSCGINSAARFAAMLGKPIQNYEEFLCDAPYHGGFLWIPKIGVAAEGIQDYLRDQDTLNDFSISQRCSRTFASQWEILINSVALGRPALALLVHSGVSMHWVNIVARDHMRENWFYLDTNGLVYELPGGDGELRHVMSADNCAAQKFNFIDRYHTVTATEGS